MYNNNKRAVYAASILKKGDDTRSKVGSPHNSRSASGKNITFSESLKKTNSRGAPKFKSNRPRSKPLTLNDEKLNYELDLGLDLKFELPPTIATENYATSALTFMSDHYNLRSNLSGKTSLDNCFPSKKAGIKSISRLKR